MKQLEQNIVYSFQLVKADLTKLQNEIIQLRNTQAILIKKLVALESRQTTVIKRIDTNTKKVKTNTKARVKRAKATKARKVAKRRKFVASETGKKFHTLNCPFAHNIKPKSRVKFKSRTKALNEGYKACSCIRK